MRDFLKNKVVLNNMLGILYILSALFYAFDLIIPFCLSMVLIIIFLFVNLFTAKQEAHTKTEPFSIKNLGMFILACVLIIKIF